jgi:hypothetical protein
MAEKCSQENRLRQNESPRADDLRPAASWNPPSIFP